MSGSLLGRNTENSRIVLGLLESVERDSAQSQRRLAAELGIAVGLVNIYLKRCVKKGLLKMTEAPARRYAYYLTPHGFSEKARLTLEYLSFSFDLFRRARADCRSVFVAARALGVDLVALAGVSELAEIATICALETGIEIVAIVDTRSGLKTFAGLPVVASYDRIDGAPHAFVVTDLKAAQQTYADLVERFGADRVLVPSMLAVETENNREISYVTINPTSRWYVVYTRPREEAKAVRNLDRQGFTCYLPRYLKRRRHARRVEMVAAPLFPRYLFVALDLATQQWWSIRSTFGVADLVYNGEQPAPIPCGIVQALQEREDERGLIGLPRRPPFMPGETVRVTDGVFSAYLGLFEGMLERERVAVLLDLLGRKVRVVMDEELLAAV